MQQQTIQTRINLESTSLAGPLAFLKGAGVAVSHHDGDVRFAVAEVVAALAEDQVLAAQGQGRGRGRGNYSPGCGAGRKVPGADGVLRSVE